MMRLAAYLWFGLLCLFKHSYPRGVIPSLLENVAVFNSCAQQLGFGPCLENGVGSEGSFGAFPRASHPPLAWSSYILNS